MTTFETLEETQAAVWGAGRAEGEGDRIVQRRSYTLIVGRRR